MTDAARRWADALGSWAIPQEILDAAPESPYGFPPDLFLHRPGEFSDSPSTRVALEAVPDGGSVLDVGCGGGAAALALVPPAELVTGIDESVEMLERFSQAAETAEVEHAEIQGSWPTVADRVDSHDVVVCHHVIYNVAELGAFVSALNDKAGRRVVIEATQHHPQSRLNPLWKHFHGLERPTSPTYEDALEVITEQGISPKVETFERPMRWAGGDPGALIAFTRKRLCLPPEKDAEIAEMLEEIPEKQPRRLACIFWDV